MAQIRQSFEKELRTKLGLKATSHQTEESLLLKAFKYFDLTNCGKINRDQFIKTIEKIGIQVNNKQDFYDLYDFYDLNKNGDLDYKEFTGIVYGVNQPNSPQKSENLSYSQIQGPGGLDDVVDKFRNKLKSRGGNGILGLGRQFKIFDDNNSRSLDMYEFKKAIDDYGVGLQNSEIQALFNYFDRNGNGNICYDEFLLGVKGPMNNFRKNLSMQAFDKLDKDGSGIVTIDDLVGVYNTKFHPEVRAGKKTEEQVFKEFLSTFENYSDIKGIGDGQLTRQEFCDYYSFISASIDNDQYFELMINNAWRMNEGADRAWDKKGWSNTQGDEGNGQSLQDGYKKSGLQSNNYEQRTEQPKQSQQSPYRSPQKQHYKQNSMSNPVTQDQDTEISAVMQKVRNKLKARGTRGFIGIQRQFKIMDDDYDKSISYQEFAKAMRDYKVELTQQEFQSVFKIIDMNGDGVLSIDELVRAIQGDMNSFRKGLVNNVFNKLDRTGDGILQLNDIKGWYNAKQHPDVKQGKKTEDEILGEFLETFEMHHNLKTGGKKDQKVNRQEFQEYYNNVSANIDNDQYFELMIINSYKLYNDGDQYKNYAPAGGRKDYDPKGWSNDMSGSFTNKSKTTQYAPFGTSNEPVNYSTNLRPDTANSQRSEDYKKAAGQSSWPSGQKNFQQSSIQQQQQQQQQNGNGGKSDIKSLVDAFRKKCASRGIRGILSLGKLFKIADDDGSHCLNFYEFKKVLNDYRLGFSQQDVEALFAYFDRDKSQSVDFDEFLRVIRGPMNQNRIKFVEMAFKKLDKTNNGVLSLDDIRGVYNAKHHPDVKSGKKTEDEILGEFLETFEEHHAQMKNDPKLKNQQVDFEEFIEYYNNVSMSIDDDRYFELMMRNAWNFDNITYKKAWAADL